MANTVALVGAALNRAGEPETTLELTERELPLAHRESDESGTWFELRWNGRQPDWLDAAKLVELGFDCSVPVTARTAELHYGKQLPRRAFVVLEHAGPSFEAWLAEQAAEIERLDAEAVGLEGDEAKRNREERDRIEADIQARSRLYAIDAGRSATALRERYPDRERHAIVGAAIGIFARDLPQAGKAEGAPDLVRGSINFLQTHRIHVNRTHARHLEELPATSAGPPRYGVTLSFGGRFEPWVVALELLDG